MSFLSNPRKADIILDSGNKIAEMWILRSDMYDPRRLLSAPALGMATTLLHVLASTSEVYAKYIR